MAKTSGAVGTVHYCRSVEERSPRPHRPGTSACQRCKKDVLEAELHAYNGRCEECYNTGQSESSGMSAHARLRYEGVKSERHIKTAGT